MSSQYRISWNTLAAADTEFGSRIMVALNRDHNVRSVRTWDEYATECLVLDVDWWVEPAEPLALNFYSPDKPLGAPG